MSADVNYRVTFTMYAGRHERTYECAAPSPRHALEEFIALNPYYGETADRLLITVQPVPPPGSNDNAGE